jgi:hypothetical protein
MKFATAMCVRFARKAKNAILLIFFYFELLVRCGKKLFIISPHAGLRLSALRFLLFIHSGRNFFYIIDSVAFGAEIIKGGRYVVSSSEATIRFN